MSKFDELIARLCPDGVEWKRLGNVAVIKRGTRVVKKNLSDSKGYPVFQNSLTPLGYHCDFNEPAGTSFVICAGAAGDIGYSDSEYWGADDCYSIECDNGLDGKYAFHVLLRFQWTLKRQVRKASIPRLSKDAVVRLEIPVPPLEIQREIVRILDNFTELEAELEAELTARKLQYAHYRDRLLSPENLGALNGKPVEMKRLDEVFDMKNGYTPSKKKAEYWENGDVNWFRMEDIRANGSVLNDSIQKVSMEGIKGGRLFEADSLIVATSATIGEHALVTVPFMCNQRFTCLTRKPAYRCKVDMNFISYYAAKLDEYCLENTNQGGFASVSMPAFKGFPIPVPSLETQQKVVDVLDRFDALTTSLTDGIPAEIEARRQQYEYYRDKLLSFPRKEES